MKTTIEWADGLVEEYAQQCPSVDVESKTIALMDEESMMTMDDNDFSAIKRIIFEPNS